MSRPRVSQKAQSGTALVVSLIIIFVMSIMGITAMRTATLGNRMTTNAIHKNTTFQAAESAVELTLSDKDNLEAAYQSLDADGSQHLPVEVPIELSANVNLETEAAILYAGTGPAIGHSLGSGGFIALQFQTIGEARIPSVQAATRVIQGAYRVVPAVD